MDDPAAIQTFTRKDLFIEECSETIAVTGIAVAVSLPIDTPGEVLLYLSFQFVVVDDVTSYASRGHATVGDQPRWCRLQKLPILCRKRRHARIRRLQVLSVHRPCRPVPSISSSNKMTALARVVSTLDDHGPAEF